MRSFALNGNGNQSITKQNNHRNFIRSSNQSDPSTFNPNRNVNNYETVEYESPKPPKPQLTIQYNTPHVNDTNTADIYYQENNEIYIEEPSNEATHKPPELLLNSSVLNDQPQYLELMQSAPDSRQSIDNSFNFPPPPPPLRSDVSAVSYRSHYLEASSLSQPRAVATLNHPNHSKNHQNYSTNSLINVKYIIDLNDLKSHFNNQQTMKSYASLATQLTSKTLLSGAITEEPSKQQESFNENPLENASIDMDYSSSKKFVVKCGCFRTCIALLNFFLGFLSCLTSAISNCCCKPCCSTAAMLGGVGGLGGLMAGAAALGVLGIIPIPIPIEYTRNICDRLLLNETKIPHNTSQIPTFFNHTSHNLTLHNLTTLNDRISDGLNVMNCTGFVGTKLTVEPESRTESEEKALRRIEKIKDELNMKLDYLNERLERTSLVRPIQYDVVFFPGTEKREEKDFQATKGVEMKVMMSMSFVCSNWTRLLRFSTRKFSTIELSFGEKDAIGVKKWSYDSLTGLLTVIATEPFTPQRLYKISVFVLYKSYGVLDEQKIGEKIPDHIFLSFNSEYESPFPALIEKFHNELITFPGPSIFNITIAKSASSKQLLIFNMDIQSITKSGKFELVNYKPTPFLHIQAISFIFGKINCAENEEDLASIKLRLCSTTRNKHLSESFDLITGYTRTLLTFYKAYTKVDYALTKIDIVIMASESILDFLNSEQVTAQLGIIYLPQSYITDNTDQLKQAQTKLKLMHLISKQLAKHWFYKYPQCRIGAQSQDLVSETLHFMQTFCQNKTCSSMEKRQNATLFLRHNQDCYLVKGVINYMAYLGLQSLQPGLFDLIRLEWALIRQLDDTYFFSDSNVKYIYQIYDFPRLSESDSILRIKTDMKALLATRSISQLLGKDRFQHFINGCFKLPNNKSTIVMDDANGMLRLLEKYARNYNMIGGFRKVRFGQVLNSWMIASDDVILTMRRNYNKKSAAVDMKFDGLNNRGAFFYPLSWEEGTWVTSENKQEVKKAASKAVNIEWVNQSHVNFNELPGGDKYIIGNTKQMFGPLRVNYDPQNWQMLISTLLHSPKSFATSERTQLIDDVFHLANTQQLSITIALSMLAYIPQETQFLPWQFLVTNLKKIITYIADDSLIYSQLRDYLIRLIKPTYHRLKWGETFGESLDDKLIRILVVDLLCSLDYEDCVENSVKQLVDSIKINVYNIPQHLAKSIYCTAIRYTGINEWLYLWRYYVQQPSESAMKDSLLYSLSCSSHVWILNLYLRKLVYEKALNVDQLPIVLEYISENPVGRYIAWNHVSQDYQGFYDKIGNDPELLLKVIQVATKQLKFKYEVKQFYEFVDDLGKSNITFKYAEGRRNKLLVNIDTRIGRYAAWKEANAGPLERWLKNQKTQRLNGL